MSNTPKLNDHAVNGLAFPPAEPADYSDEMTLAQIELLRGCWTQDEAKMGSLVHEFTW